jgi:transposase InsO family protein
MKRTKRAKCGAITDQIIDMAVMLRREVPSRSIETIIKILEMEDVVAEGELKRTTLQENLAKRGYSTRQMKMYANSPGVATRRFSKKRRMHLVHSDIKYGPYLPIGPDGKMQQVYLVTVLDDATRYMLHAQFYPVLDQTIVQESLRMAMMKFGLMESVFFDNGVQYRTKWMRRACGKLGIRLLYARPYSPEATGKPEKFNRLVDNFLAEAALEKPKTLKTLNELFDVWLTECYQNRPHAALGGKTPQAVFHADPTSLRFIAPEIVANAFLHYEERKVDKTGCISFRGKKYEAGLKYMGCTVGVVYDPLDIREITIEYQDNEPLRITELVIGTNTGKRPNMPETLRAIKPDSSRLLAGAKKANEKRRDSQKMILSFRKTGTNGGEGIV